MAGVQVPTARTDQNDDATDPPQCGGPSLVVRGLDLTNVENLESTQGVTWGQAQLRGRVSNGVLEVQATR
jgi:hypothetical protein